MTTLTEHFDRELDLQKRILKALGQIHQLVHGSTRATTSVDAELILQDLHAHAEDLQEIQAVRQSVFEHAVARLAPESSPQGMTLRDLVEYLSPLERQTLLDQRQDLRRILQRISERHNALARSLQLKSASQIEVLQRIASVLMPGTYDANGPVPQRSNSVISAQA